MNPFAIGLVWGSMDKDTKRKAAPSGGRRAIYVTIRGEKIKTTARGKRIFRAVTQALKGVDVPPR